MSAPIVARRAISAAWIFVVTAAALSGQNFQPPSAPTDVPNEQARSTTPDRHLQQELKLAGDFLAGRGVPKDAERAAYWYRKAADQGDPAAQAELGYFYASGIGVRADQAEAAKWYERAMAGGSRTAKLNLAVMYLKGTGIKRDPQLGIDLLHELSKGKDPRAESYLGIVYFMGYGVKADHALAEKWFAQAAKQHRAEAEYEMGSLYSVVVDHAHDFPKAAEFLRSAVQGGYVPAMHSLGLLLVNHPELTQKTGEAIAMLEAAANGGSWRSSAVLGVLARDGKYESRDAAEAYRWFLIAERQGGAEAEKLVNADRALCEKTLDAPTQEAVNERANAWLVQHPHTDLFVFGDKLQTGQFPVTDVPVLGLAEAN
jgi:TPR repeat protein